MPKSLGVEKRQGTATARRLPAEPGTSNENTLADWARANSVEYKPVVIEHFNEVVNAFAGGPLRRVQRERRIGRWRRSAFPSCTSPDDYVVLPEIISKEPLGPFVRQGDDNWLNIVFAGRCRRMIEAEEYGITVGQRATS